MDGPRVHLTADGGSVAVDRGGPVLAEGRLARGRAWFDAQVEVSPPIDAEATGALLAQLVRIADVTGGPPVRWIVSDPGAGHDRAAADAGLTEHRDLLQLRRPLPVDDGAREGLPTPALRPFVPGVDDAAWLEVNNRSFADHPDQGGLGPADLHRLTAEPWFDAEGLLVLDADRDGPRRGHLDGFCWTKVHDRATPPLGEIFVIGVDPSAHGHRLGPALTMAGLDHLASRGLRTGMLYVDLANTTAMAMYERLGFTRHGLDRIYTPPR